MLMLKEHIWLDSKHSLLPEDNVSKAVSGLPGMIGFVILT